MNGAQRAVASALATAIILVSSHTPTRILAVGIVVFSFVLGEDRP